MTDSAGDRELVARAQAGDLGAFDELVRRYGAALYRYAWRNTRNAAAAEELAQEAFVHAWKGLGRFRGDAGFRTWLYRIATNLCINRAKRRRPTEELPEDLAAGPQGEPDARYRERARAAAVEQALGQLPADQRAAVVLSVYDNLSQAEIAVAMGRSVASVNSLCYRGRLALRELLAPARKAGIV
ncbi:MAG: sigma-70 family RNA polymerase sigma factor [bacterium]